EENEVKDIAKSQSNVHYLGYQPKENTIALIRGSDVLIQPSLIEGMSSTILEAMAPGTPIVATKVGGNKEILEHNKSGILVDANSGDEILEKALEVISDKKKAESLGSEALKRSEERRV